MKRTNTLSLPIYELLDIFYIEDITESNVKIDEAINDLQETFNNIIESKVLQSYSGKRPNGKCIGDMKFDTTLKKPVWWNGTNWILSDGTIAF